MGIESRNYHVNPIDIGAFLGSETENVGLISCAHRESWPDLQEPAVPVIWKENAKTEMRLILGRDVDLHCASRW